MSHYTDELLVEIVGIEASGDGRACEAHKVCDALLQLNTAVRFQTLQIINGKFFISAFVHLFFFTFDHADDGIEETAIGVYWVTDGIDRCLVGFLPKHCVHHRHKYDGRVAQVVEFLRDSKSPSQRRRSRRKQGICMVAFLR